MFLGLIGLNFNGSGNLHSVWDVQFLIRIQITGFIFTLYLHLGGMLVIYHKYVR